MRSIVSIVRGVASLVLFALFGAGALAVAPLMLVLRRPERAMPVVRFLWRVIVALFAALRLVRIDRGNLASPRGTIIAANHPSLIDVVLLTAMLPRTLYVAKAGLRVNPFLAAVVRATSLPNDARLMDAANRALCAGWNVLVFPEGTRSPDVGMHPFHRGAAQLAVRTGAPLLAVGIVPSRRILGKRQPPWQVGDRLITYAFRADASTREGLRPGETTPAAAKRVTADLRRRIEVLVA